MTKFRFVLVLVCLGLLGAMPFVISASKPDTAGDQREAAVQGQTAVQRQMAAQELARYTRVRAEIGRTLLQARDLAATAKYKEALAAVDGLQIIPNKTVAEAKAIDQMRDVLVRAKAGQLDSQVR